MSKRHGRRRVAEDIPENDDDIILLEADGGEVPPPQPAPEPEAEDKTPDPLDVLRREVDEHKSARAEAERKLAAEKAERDRAAADNATSRLAADKIAIEQAYSAAEARAVAAKRAFADAMTAQDFNAAAESQAAIARVENEMQRYADAYAVIEDRSRQEPPAQPAPAAKQESLDDAIARIPDAATRDWANEHKDDLQDPKRLKLAYAADALATARGLVVGSDAYLDFLDEQLGYEMEETPPAAPPPPAPARRRGPPVAAPVSRGGGGKVSVTLSEIDKSLAQQAGLTPKEYARSILAAKKDPRYHKYSNRLQ